MLRRRAGARALTTAGALALTLFFVAAHALFGLGVSHAQPLNTEPDRLRLEVDEITPRMVRQDSDALTVTGSITNVGDRRITDLVARVELGNRLTSDDEARAALDGPLPHYRSTSTFTSVTRSLRPGQTSRLRLRVPVNGDRGGLSVSRPGVYPLLINVNGTPEFGGTARLVATNLLLPVLSGREDSVPDGPDNTDGTSSAMGLTVLWPITARKPPVVRDVYGKRPVLADDTLADSLAPGGRLYSLVDAASNALQRGRLSPGMCFAVDPALLTTVQQMSDGYRVRGDDGLQKGKGAKAAAQWLEELHQLVDDQCVIQIPYADTDLSSLPRIGSTGKGSSGLVPLAVNGADVIGRTLDTRPLSGVLWPGATVSGEALDPAAKAGVSDVLSSPARLPLDSIRTAGTTGVDLTGSSVRAQTFDPLLHRALRHRPGTADVAVQNGLAALVFRTRQHQATEFPPVLLAPPHRWGAAADELNDFLRELGDFASAAVIEPVPLQQSLEEETTASASAEKSISDAGYDVTGNVVQTLSDVDSRASELTSAMSLDAASGVQPEAVVRPLRQAVLRAGSTAWANAPSRRMSAVRAARSQVEAITSQVKVTPPNQPIALASNGSPLPVYISNSLPVTVTVRIAMLNKGGLRPERIPQQTIPANSARNRNINIEALRAGHITVQVELTTPDGLRLGEVTRFELASTEYGIITIVVTCTAAGALLLLSGRRIYRRVRARKATASES